MFLNCFYAGTQTCDGKLLIQFLERNHSSYIRNLTALERNADGLIFQDEPQLKRDYCIYKVTFKNIVFSGDFHDIKFLKCNFIKCKFIGTYGFYLIYNKCKFFDCYFFNSTFSHIELVWDEVYFIKCRFRNVEIDEAGLLNTFFETCYITGLSIDGLYPVDNVRFDECTLEGSQFRYVNAPIGERECESDEFDELLFDNCSISDTVFNTVDLKYSRFWNTVLYKCSFLDCLLSADTINLCEEPKNACYATMDFQTILKSESISEEILSLYFNIKNGEDMKEIAKTVTSEIDFFTVFFSYSFKDQEFVSRLNDALISHGIRTFMWQRDAPGGKTLTEIMVNGIQKNDKVLFVASEHSIKSKACQFELSIAREKQENEWTTILFPIHIDKYLFSIEKDKIRPISKQNEYWENIEELRRVNSLDFSKMASGDIDDVEVDAMIGKLVQNLRVEDPSS